MKTLDSFEDVLKAAGPDLRSTIVSMLLDEARLMLALVGARLTERAIGREVDEAQNRFHRMVDEYYRNPRPLTADDIIDRRAICHVAWAIAEKIRERAPAAKEAA